MPTIILYAVEIAEMEAWVGARDTRLLREAKQIVREEVDGGWDEPDLAVLDRLLDRMIQEGRLYEGLDEPESYYLTQLLIDASDGFILVPHVTPGGLDEFADKVVPLLQERGVFRTEYTGTTLRDHLGLAPLPAGKR